MNFLMLTRVVAKLKKDGYKVEVLDNKDKVAPDYHLVRLRISW